MENKYQFRRTIVTALQIVVGVIAFVIFVIGMSRLQGAATDEFAINHKDGDGKYWIIISLVFAASAYFSLFILSIFVDMADDIYSQRAMLHEQMVIVRARTAAKANAGDLVSQKIIDDAKMGPKTHPTDLDPKAHPQGGIEPRVLPR